MVDIGLDELAQLKLRALDRWHASLLESYDRIEDSLPTTTHERIDALVEGLGELRFADRALHADDAKPLDASIAFNIDLGELPASCAEAHLAKVETALAQGRCRALCGRFFGALLEDWSQRCDTDDSHPPDDGEGFLSSWLSRVCEPAAPTPDAAALIDAVLEPNRELLEGAGPLLQHFAEHDLTRAVEEDEVVAHLRLVAANPGREATQRDSARRVINDRLVLRDVVGALTLLINEYGSGWLPARPTVRAVWKRSRWRGFFDLELLDLLMVEVLGMRWAIAVKQLLAVPELRPTPTDVQTGSVLDGLETAISTFFLPSVPLGWAGFREVGRSPHIEYEGFRFTDTSPDATQTKLSVLNSWMRVLEKRHPGAPLCLVHVDIREFFRELPHDVVHHLLQSLGVPEAWARWVVDVFRFELGDGRRVARGVPLNTTLSYLVAELLLRVVELRVYRENDVRLIRFLDDIYFCCADPEQAEAAYRTLCDAVTRLGLELNVEKSGAVCLRGELPATLPQAPLRFGFLRLEPDGAWMLDDEAVAPYLDALRESLERSDSVLAIVSNYNGYLNYLLRGVAPFVPLAGREGNPVDHISAVARSVQRMHRTIVGGDTAIAEHLTTLMRERLGERWPSSAAPVVEALLYWPIALGGLGLCSPAALLTGYHRARVGTRVPEPRPMAPAEDPILDDEAHWLTSANRWGELFATWQRGVEAQAAVRPADLDEARIEAYNAAHVVACGEAPDELSPYWSWVIALYGETVRAALGRDTALDSALVPLHLVAECRGLSAVFGDEAEHGGQAQSPYRSDAHLHHSDGLFDSLTRASSGQTVFAAESNPVRFSSSDDDIPF